MNLIPPHQTFPISDNFVRDTILFDFCSSVVSTFSQLKVDTISTCNHLKVETPFVKGLYL